MKSMFKKTMRTSHQRKLLPKRLLMKEWDDCCEDSQDDEEVINLIVKGLKKMLQHQNKQPKRDSSKSQPQRGLTKLTKTFKRSILIWSLSWLWYCRSYD